MDTTARRYARRVLLVHAALLLAVLATVAVAGRGVYRAARAEVLAEAERRQQMLAASAKQGIENHYASILTDMDLLRRANMAAETTSGSSGASAATRPSAAMPGERALNRFLSSLGRNPGAGQVIGGIMWRQLQGRASLLFTCDRSMGAADAATAAAAAAGPAVATMVRSAVRSLGEDRGPLGSHLIGTDDATLTPALVLARSAAWVEAQHSPSIGEFGRWGDVAGNLVCVPLREEAATSIEPGGRSNRTRRTSGGVSRFGGRPEGEPPFDGRGGGRREFDRRPPPDDEGGGPPPDEPTSPREQTTAAASPTTGPAHAAMRALVAVVPIAKVEHDFLLPLGNENTVAWLVDARWTAMAASRADLVGTDMARLSDVALAALVRKYAGGHGRGCEVIDRPFRVGSATVVPSMVAAESVSIGGGTNGGAGGTNGGAGGDRRWELFIATSLDSVDGSVNQLTRRAVAWGGGVAMAVALILMSTSIGLIRGRVRVERLRHSLLTRELAQARQIQLAWLPKALPAGPVDVAAVNSPASHISGDFYNWFDLPDGRLAIAIGDVTGHGMSAAFLMATTQLLVRTTLARTPDDPGACLVEVNRQLCVQAYNEQFVTMLVAVLDPATRQLAVATAGHPSPMVVAEAGGATCPLVIEPQLMLGVDPDATYPTESHCLPPGAALVLYTDGVIECPATDGRRFGTDRLQLATAAPGSAQSLVDGVVAAVDAFRGARPLDDDLTVVAVQLRPTTSGV